MGEKEPIDDFGWARPFRLLVLIWSSAAVLLLGCTDDGDSAAHVPPGKYTPAPGNYRHLATYLDSVADSLHYACYRSDSLFTSQRLALFEDTALARARPDLTLAGFYCDIIAHNSYPSRTLERLLRVADAVDSDGLRVWHDYFIGRHRQNIGDHLGAIELFLDVLPKFTEMTDNNGIATVSKRIGFMYLESLQEPEKALQYLQRAYALEPNIEDKYDIVQLIELCYRELELPDSMSWCMDFYQAHRQAAPLVIGNDARADTYTAWAAFDQCALRIIRDGHGDADRLRLCFAEARMMLERAEGNSLTDASEDQIREVQFLLLNARALMRLKLSKDASRSLVEAEGILNKDTGQHALEAEVYSLLSELNKSRGATGNALRYRELQLDAMRLADRDEERSIMASALAKAAFDQELRNGQEQYQVERAQAQAAIERVRTQRIILLAVSVLILVIAALLVNRYRLKRRLQVAQLRASLSRDLHDDIGSTLSSINILSNVARKKAEVAGDLDAAASLDKISDRSQRLMRNMSDIVWSVDPNKDTLEELLMRMREFATSVLEGAGISHTIDFPQNAPTIALSPETKNNLYLIFKEAVNNVVKHAEAKQVEVRIAMVGGALRMEVKDDGKGFDPSIPTNGHGGNGLRNMKARAAELKANLSVECVPLKGTTMVLVLHLERSGG